MYVCISLGIGCISRSPFLSLARSLSRSLALPRSLSLSLFLSLLRAGGRSWYSVQMRVIYKLTDSLCVSLALTLGTFVQSVLGVRTCVCEFAPHTCTRIHTYKHIYTRTRTHTRFDALALQSYTHTNTHTHTHTLQHTLTHTHTHTPTHTHTHTYTRTHAHTQTHAHTLQRIKERGS